MRVRVMAVRDETPRIRSFELAAETGGELPPFTPGAHIRLVVPVAADRTERRAYSLWGDPADRTVYRIAVLREDGGRGGSRALHDSVRVGDVLACEGPDNAFPLAADATDSVLIAGGIGITPILSMARALSIAGKPFHVHYAVRSVREAALLDELYAVADGRLTLYLDGGDPQRGVPLDAVLARPAAGRHVYVCGPGPLIDAVVRAAADRRWPAAQVHFERFGAPAAGADDAPFEVVLRRSGVTVPVGAGETVLDALLAAGQDPMHDCRAGNCGLCLTPVLEADGALVHRDSFLSEAQKQQGDQMCICVSRTRGQRLVLDL